MKIIKNHKELREAYIFNLIYKDKYVYILKEKVILLYKKFFPLLFEIETTNIDDFDQTNYLTPIAYLNIIDAKIKKII